MQGRAGGAVGVADAPAARVPTTPVAAPVRVAVIGCGAMTRENLLPVLAGHERVRLVALVDLNETTARALAEAYGSRTVMTAPQTLDRHHIDQSSSHAARAARTKPRLAVAAFMCSREPMAIARPKRQMFGRPDRTCGVAVRIV